MRTVTIRLHNLYIATTIMTTAEIKKAENAGFTVIER